MAPKKQKQEQLPKEQSLGMTSPPAATEESSVLATPESAAALPDAALDDVEEPSAQELQQVETEEE